MKNKKLFAILTLVCFMFTLMPVAAFAATEYVAVGTDDSIRVEAGKSFKAEVANKTTDSAYHFWAVDGEDKVVALSEDGTFTFDDVDTYYVYAVAAVKETTTSVFQNVSYTKAQVVNIINDRYKNLIVEDYLTVKVKAADVTYKLAASTKDLGIKADNGWSKDGKVTITLTKTGDKAVKNAAIEYTTNSGYVDVEVEESLTDRSGEQVIYITASRAGEYKVYANYEDAEELVINVKVDAKGIATVTTVAEPAKGTALDTTFVKNYGGFTGVAFEIVTADGTVLDTATPGTAGKDYKISIVEQPEDSDLDAKDLYLSYDAKTNKAYILKSDKNVGFEVEGKYVFKVTLESGSAATATVNVVEFDEPVMMSLTYEANAVSYNDVAIKKALVYIDKNGTVLSAAHPDYDKMGTVEYAASGKAVKDVLANGNVETKDDDELIGTKITVIAINDKLELTATAELEVVDKAATLAYADTTAKIAVNNKLVANTVDENGNIVASGLDKEDKVSVYVLDAPENAVYYVKGAVTGVDEVTVDFTASAAGEYKLQTVVKHEKAYYSCVETIVVDGTVSNFDDVVVMSIGSKTVIVNNEAVVIDAAPIVENNRTFVPFRALAEAFGATVAYDEATQSVTAELDGTTVVMTIGSAEYTVNGEVKTADVAPFINGSRTMVPVRFVAEAFGINVTALYGENGATVDVLFAK